MNGWQIFEQICEWGWIVAGILLAVVLIYLIVTALSLKNSAMRNAKRLYERPVNSGKNLAATGKAIVQQETVRVRHIAGTARETATVIKEAATEIKEAAQTIHPEELKAGLANAKSALRFVSAAMQFVRATSQQNPSQTEA